MKTTNAQIINRKAGMTLLELTVVILVLLSLIAILFVGARAWKKGSDRSSNILNIRNTQQAMRGEMNMKNISELDVTDNPENKDLAFTRDDLEEFMKFPLGVATVTYTEGAEFTVFADEGTETMDHIWLVVDESGWPEADYGHQKWSDIESW